MIVETIPIWLAVQWWMCAIVTCFRFFSPRIRWLDGERWGLRGCMWAGGLGEKGQTYDFLKPKNNFSTERLMPWGLSILYFASLPFWQLEAHPDIFGVGPLGAQTKKISWKRRFGGLFVVKATWIQLPARAELFVRTCQKWAGISYSTCCFWRFEEHLMRTQWSNPHRFCSAQGHHSIDKGWSRMCTLALMWGRFMFFLGIVEFHVS